MTDSAALPAVGRAVEDHFAALDDRRFVSASELDDPRLQTLQALLAARGRVTPAARRRIAAAFINAGAWLRQLHTVKVEGLDPPRGASVAEVKDALRENAAGVAGQEGDESVEGVAERICAAIDAGALRDPIAVGLSHGALAPDRVLVSPEGAVAGVGIESRGRAPIYEDIAHFVMSLRMRRARGRSNGTQRFLSGYFEDAPVPQRALAVFALSATFDEWAQAAAGREGIRDAAAARALRAEVNALYSLLER